jgi:hypothetical protein
LKATFVLDENVLIQSHTCKNIEDDGENYASHVLVSTIYEKCHNIGLSPKLRESYYDKIKTLEQQKPFSGITTRIWTRFLSRNDKHKDCESQLSDLPSKVLHDRHVIEPAFFLKGILVTTDGKLKENMRGWLETHSPLLIMSPQEAFDYLVSL